MRINLEKCRSYEEYRNNRNAFDEALSKEGLHARIYAGVLEVAGSPTPDLKGRAVIEKAQKKFLKNNPLYKERFEKEKLVLDSVVKIDIPEIPPTRDIPGKEQEAKKKKLLGSPNVISIITTDGKTLTAPLGILPDFFAAAARHEGNTVLLDCDSYTANLFLNYEHGLGIKQDIPLSQLLRLHRLSDYLQAEDLHRATLNALINAMNDGNREIILRELFTEILTKSPIDSGLATAVFYQQISKAKKEFQRELLDHLQHLSHRDKVALYHYGIFYRRGIGTAASPATGLKYIRIAAAHHFYPAHFYLENINKIDGFRPDSENAPEPFSYCIAHHEAVSKFPYLPIVLDDVRIREALYNMKGPFSTKLYELLSSGSDQDKKMAREYLESKPEDPLALFHLAIFYQEGIGGERDDNKALETLIKASREGYWPAIDYLSERVENKTILELYGVDFDFYTPRISLEDLFAALTPNPPLHAVKDFYKKIKTARRDVQRDFKIQLENRAARQDPIAKYHLARFYLEGIGVLKNERKALELLKESAAAYYLPAEEYLGTKNHNVAQGPQVRLALILRELRKSPGDTVDLKYQEGFDEGIIRVHRAFLPHNFDSASMGEINSETLRLFVNFQYGLGIPADAPFERLVELYQLAHLYEDSELMKASSDLISKSFTTSNQDELLPKLFNLILLDEKPYLYEKSIAPIFFEHLGKATPKTQEQFRVKIHPLAEKKNAVALNLLGFYFELRSSKQNALACYKAAAKQNNALAQYNHGRLDPDAGLPDLKLAENQGLSIAQTEIGLRLANGSLEEQRASTEYLKKAAGKGNAVAQYHLGILNSLGRYKQESDRFFQLALDQGYTQALYGLGSNSSDPHEAFLYFKEGADEGNIDCLLALSRSYFEGLGVQKDSVKGFECYLAAAEKGDTTALYHVGRCYRDGLGVEKNNIIAFRYFKESADLGDARAQYIVGKYYTEDLGAQPRNLAKSFEYYKKAADQGHQLAQNAVGICYEDGIGVPADQKLACLYYEKIGKHSQAFVKDFARAANFLGYCYKQGFTRQDGSVIEPNNVEAIRYFIIAADGGIASAANEAGIYYEQGQGAESYGLALHYYQKALEGGADFPEAHYYVGIRSQTVNHEDVLMHMLAAADLGYAKAEYEVGQYYKRGDYTAEKDQALASQYYERSAKQGHIKAQYEIGTRYLEGIGVGKDEKKGFAYLKEAADKHFALAQDAVGMCYLKGKGTPIDVRVGLGYLGSAASKGLPIANYHLGEYYSEPGPGYSDWIAYEHFDRAAHERPKLPEAQYKMGMINRYGELGHPKVEKNAIEYLQEAAKLGYQPAIEELKKKAP